ncbi:hypothetical protein [Miltoncostaea marina]|uniref:hypothetical protein n=1 Tax=Miltoncostaea marina TaxID=2843215 RepID=UPI001C3E3BAB|nr:hypothetical protein [Miltoncostaea marina]
MFPRLRDDGTILLPLRAEGQDGVAGERAEVIGPDDARYEALAAALRERQAAEAPED